MKRLKIAFKQNAYHLQKWFITELNKKGIRYSINGNIVEIICSRYQVADNGMLYIWFGQFYIWIHSGAVEFKEVI